ncbi:7-cyano-7-deazaguanine synthase [Gordonia alkanivorans]|uniref:7-cyano-7-deazaguanine synthase n=1 Tax=Gordonia alkanivorans NBRC 16433 TaxID=1027371 RepID=F9W271_9ACTN|nr:queuosine biosynthesis protein QueC [Gordonia alkanivorans NBRC 16433]
MILIPDAPHIRSVGLMLSGGLDSSVCAAWLTAQSIAVFAIQLHHPRRPRREVTAADTVIALLGLERRDICVPPPNASAHIPRTVQLSVGLTEARGLGVERLVLADLRSDLPRIGTSVHRLTAEADYIENGSRGPEMWLPFWDVPKLGVKSLADDLAFPVGLTWSCDLDREAQCGACGGCLSRRSAGIA